MLLYHNKKSGRSTQRIKLFLAALVAFITADTLAQGLLVLNGDVAVNTAFVVVDNSNPNTMNSSGNGHIHSEGEFNVLRSNIGNGTGTFELPFGDS